jgi:hypothetical protein
MEAFHRRSYIAWSEAPLDWRLHILPIFHHPETWKTFEGLPDHANIAILQKEVNSNAMAIPSDRGVAEHFAITGDVFIATTTLSVFSVSLLCSAMLKRI